MFSHGSNLELLFKHFHLFLIIIRFFFAILNLQFKHFIQTVQLSTGFNCISSIIFWLLIASEILKHEFFGLEIHEVHLVIHLYCCVPVVFFKIWTYDHLTDFLNEIWVHSLNAAV